MSKVSVLMSIYQPDQRYLAEQLETIDIQDFADMEVLIYDDCPDEPSWESFCRAHCASHPLRYEKGATNLGYVKAFEHLVSMATGDYVALADQDDRWLAGRVSQAVQLLDEGAVLVSCDRQIIDGEGEVVEESWRQAHPHDDSVTWHTGDHITAKAAFSCYSIGMATMLRTDVAQSLMPYPTCTGHDKWLALGASALGIVANIECPLVQYRIHGKNQTSTLAGISSKADWYHKRTQHSYELVEEFAQRFPDSPDLAEMRAFAQARIDGSVGGIWQHRKLAPQVAYFEMALRFVPDWMFRQALGILRR